MGGGGGGQAEAVANAAAGAGAAGTALALADKAGRAQEAEEARLAAAGEALATPEAKHTATLDVTEAAAVNAAAGAGAASAAGTGRALADEAGRAQGAEEARLAAAGEALATGKAKEAAARRPGQASAEAAAAAEATASAADEKGLTLEEKWPEPAEGLRDSVEGPHTSWPPREIPTRETASAEGEPQEQTLEEPGHVAGAGRTTDQTQGNAAPPSAAARWWENGGAAPPPWRNDPAAGAVALGRAQAAEALATPEARHAATLAVTEAAVANAAAGAGAAGTARALADKAGRARGAEEARLAADTFDIAGRAEPPPRGVPAHSGVHARGRRRRRGYWWRDPTGCRLRRCGQVRVEIRPEEDESYGLRPKPPRAAPDARWLGSTLDWRRRQRERGADGGRGSRHRLRRGDVARRAHEPLRGSAGARVRKLDPRGHEGRGVHHFREGRAPLDEPHRIAYAAWGNQNVVQVMKTRRSKNRYVRYLLAIITRCEIEHKFMLLAFYINTHLAFYINTHHNHPADDISREFGKWLHLGYDVAVAKMQEHFPEYAHLRHEPMNALRGHLSDERHALRSFAFPAEAEDPNSLAHQLAQARCSPSPWARLQEARGPGGPGAGTVAVVEIRAGLGRLAAAMEAIGFRVHGLVDADPLARQGPERRFPAAVVHGQVGRGKAWAPGREESLVVLATAASPETASDVAKALADRTRSASPIMVAVLLIDVGEWGAHYEGLGGLRRELQRGGRQLAAHLRLNAAEWGAATCMGVEILMAAVRGGSSGPRPPTVVRGPLVGTGAGPQHPRSILRAEAAVPPGSCVPVRLSPWRGKRPPVQPIPVAWAGLGGAGVDPFPGALGELAGEPTRLGQLWRVKETNHRGRLLVGPVGGGPAVTAEHHQVHCHLSQRGVVLAIDAVGKPPAASAAAPAGVGNNLILDHRLGPEAARALPPDECFRLQGHGDEVRETVEALRQGGLAGRGVPSVVAVEVARRVAEAVELGASEPEDRCGGGKPRHTTANLRAGERGVAALQEAEAELFRTQLAKGSRAVYDRGFSYWAIWRACRDRGPYMQGGTESFEDEGELIKFVAYFGVVCEYAHQTVHGWLHGIQHTHIVNGLGDPLAGKLRLRLVRKGLRRLDRRRRGPTRKLAVTVSILLEFIMNGGLDFNDWDSAVLEAAIIFGFFKLRRSGEFLRKGAEPDADYCVRVGDIALAKDGKGVRLNTDGAAEADELIATQRRSKADQDWNGSETNTFITSDARLCVVSWVKHLVSLRPEHFDDPNRFLFTLSDGKVLSRDKVSKVLKEAAMRKGLDEDDVDVISLRAGGASAMYHAGFSVEEIQRRGRWASGCWKGYVHAGRTKAKDTAERMAKADFQLLR